MSFTIDKFSMETYLKNFFIPVNYIVKINKKINVIIDHSISHYQVKDTTLYLPV